MEYYGKKLKDIIVTLPLDDGTEMTCGVYAYFTVNNKEYFALQARLEDGMPNPEIGLMLYEVIKDAEDNPIVIYIEDDNEYAIAADYFSANY